MKINFVKVEFGFNQLNLDHLENETSTEFVERIFSKYKSSSISLLSAIKYGSDLTTVIFAKVTGSEFYIYNYCLSEKGSNIEFQVFTFEEIELMYNVRKRFQL